MRKTADTNTQTDRQALGKVIPFIISHRIRQQIQINLFRTVAYKRFINYLTVREIGLCFK